MLAALLVFLLLFALVLKVVFGNLIEEDLHDSEDFKAAGLLRRVPRGKRKTRFPDCTETPEKREDSQDEGEQN